MNPFTLWILPYPLSATYLPTAGHGVFGSAVILDAGYNLIGFSYGDALSLLGRGYYTMGRRDS